MATFPLARRNPHDAAQDNRVALVKRSLFNALKGLDPALLQRDLAGLTGDTRRKALLSRQIAELLDRLKSEDVEKALSRPLGEAYREGFGARPSRPLGEGGRDARGPSAEVALDTDKLRSLARALTDPLTDAMHRAKSPLPYVLPKLVQPDQKEAFLGAAMEAAAQGMTSRQFAKLLREKGTFDRQTLRTADGGPFVEFPNGYRMGAGRYVETVAKTTTYWASNRGVMDRCAEDGIELVEVVENPGTIDFCLELEGKVFALTGAAAEKAGVPLLGDCPNGGPPFHPNCRHSLAPYVWLGEKLSAVDPDVAAHDKASMAQREFLKKLDEKPEKYARQIAESAALRTFGEREAKVPDELAGREIPGIVGRKEYFPPAGKTALAEDVLLAKRIDEGAIGTRAEYRVQIAETLRNGSGNATVDADKNLRYTDNGWTVVVEPKSGLVVDAFKRRSEDVEPQGVNPSVKKTRAIGPVRNDDDAEERRAALMEAGAEVLRLKDEWESRRAALGSDTASGGDVKARVVKLQAAIEAERAYHAANSAAIRAFHDSIRHPVGDRAEITVDGKSSAPGIAMRDHASNLGAMMGSTRGGQVGWRAARGQNVYYQNGTVYSRGTAKEDYHELGHWVEARDTELRQEAQAFLARRGTGVAELRALGYRARRGVKAVTGDFVTAYVGRIYKSGATEVISVGLEQMMVDPVGFAKKDPEHFRMILRMLGKK